MSDLSGLLPLPSHPSVRGNPTLYPETLSLELFPMDPLFRGPDPLIHLCILGTCSAQDTHGAKQALKHGTSWGVNGIAMDVLTVQQAPAGPTSNSSHAMAHTCGCTLSAADPEGGLASGKLDRWELMLGKKVDNLF